MSTREKSPVFGSSEQFDENRVGAAAVYCSDGRYGEHFDGFLHNALKLPRYDRLALPGGAACLAGHFLLQKLVVNYPAAGRLGQGDGKPAADKLVVNLRIIFLGEIRHLIQER